MDLEKLIGKENVFNGSITLKISKLKLRGGTYGAEGYLGAVVILENALVEPCA